MAKGEPQRRIETQVPLDPAALKVADTCECLKTPPPARPALAGPSVGVEGGVKGVLG